MSKPQDPPASKKRKVDSPKTPASKSSARYTKELQKLPSQPQLTSAAAKKDVAVTAIPDAEKLNDLTALQKHTSSLGFSRLSPLQRQIIPALLAGKDVVAVSAPGRDAMLSFLIPAVALLEKHHFHARHGTGILVVTPNRETAVQISGLASELLAGTTHTVGIVMDGANRGSEEQKLERGINLLVATPTRLLEHIRDTTSFVFKNLKAFWLCGADSVAQLGMEKQIREIITRIPKKDRLSMIFGIEQTDELSRLSELICRPEVVERHTEISLGSERSKEPQGYVIVEADKRFLLLYSFLRKFQRKKIVAIMSSTPSVMYGSEVLSSLDIPVHSIHGKQNLKARLAAFSDFVKEPEGTLLLTGEAAQWLEIPSVDWVIQYDPPRSIREFIQRRGKIQGRPVAFVQPGESSFVDQLKAADIVVEEFDFPKKKLLNVQPQIEKLVSKNFEVHQLAKEGFRVFLQDYNHHGDSQIFDVTRLDVRKVGKSFGFKTPPRVEVKTVAEVKVDKYARPYGPEKPKEDKKRKAR